MKWCKAWPEDCVQSGTVSGGAAPDAYEPDRTDRTDLVGPTGGPHTGPAADTRSAAKLATSRGIVLPKHLVTAAVEASVEGLLKEAFPGRDGPEGPAEDDPEAFDPFTSGSGVKQPRAHLRRSGASHGASATNMTPVWIAVGAAFAVLLLLIQSLWSRVQSLEAYVTGRLGRRPYD